MGIMRGLRMPTNEEQLSRVAARLGEARELMQKAATKIRLSAPSWLSCKVLWRIFMCPWMQKRGEGVLNKRKVWHSGWGIGIAAAIDSHN